MKEDITDDSWTLNIATKQCMGRYCSRLMNEHIGMKMYDMNLINKSWILILLLGNGESSLLQINK